MAHQGQLDEAASDQIRSRAGSCMGQAGQVAAAMSRMSVLTQSSVDEPTFPLPTALPHPVHSVAHGNDGVDALVGEMIGHVGGTDDVLVEPMLSLKEGEMGGGPVTLPRPRAMEVEVVKAAHNAWNHVVGWRDGDTLYWLTFCLRMAHRHKAYKTTALRVLSRVAISGPHNGGRTCNSVLQKLKAVARQMALHLLPELLAYRAEHGLTAALQHIQSDAREPETQWRHHLISCDDCGMAPIVGPRFHALGRDFDRCEACFAHVAPSDRDEWELFSKPGSSPKRQSSTDAPCVGSGDRPAVQPCETDDGIGNTASAARQISTASISSMGSEADPSRMASQPSDGASYLTQRQYLAFFGPDFESAITSGHVGVDKSLWYERGLICMLSIVSHYVQDIFHAQTAALGGARARHRLAPPKTYERMFNKSQSDYVDRPSPGAMYNKDPIRKSILNETAADQAAVWDDLLAAGYAVLGAKNTFTFSDAHAREETQGMMQILVNIAFHPKQADGTPLTFGAMLKDTAGFKAAVSAAKASSGPGQRVAFDVAAQLFRKLPGLGSQPITLIAEIQLHLQYYLKQRKKTHLWFKIQRAETLADLAYDCVKYRNADNGPRTTNEALWSEWEKDGGLNTHMWMVEAAGTGDGDALTVWNNLPSPISDALTNSYRAWKKGNERHSHSNLKMNGQRCTFYLQTMTATFADGDRKIRPPDNLKEVLAAAYPTKTPGQKKLSAFMKGANHSPSKESTSKTKKKK